MTLTSHMRRSHYSKERWARLYARALRFYRISIGQ